MKVEPCAVASLLVVFTGVSLGCRVLISFGVGIFMMFDSATESIKNLFQGLVVEILYFLDFLQKGDCPNFFFWWFF